MNLDDLSIGQAKALAAMLGDKKEELPCPYAAAGLIGTNVMVRTVTMIYIGRLVSVGEHELTLMDVAWIPETGRWGKFIADGNINECEPYPNGMAVLIGRSAVIDACLWSSALPRSQK